MRLAGLILANLTVSPVRLLVMASLCGLASAAVLGIINIAGELATSGSPQALLFFLFLAAVFVYVVSQRYVLLVSVREVEQIVDAIRRRIFEKVLKSDQLALERIGHSTVFSAIAKETQTISQTVNVLVSGAQAALLLLFSTLYLAFLSMPALIVGGIFTTLSMLVLVRRNHQIHADIRASMVQEAELFDVLRDTLSGFKETKMNSARAAGLLEDFRERSQTAIHTIIRARALIATATVLSQFLVYCLLGTMVFAVPLLFPSASHEVVKTATAVLFMIGPLTAIVNAFPMLSMADAAAANIADIEAALDRGAPASTSEEPKFPGFSRLSIQGVRFRHGDARQSDAFELGPVDLEISAGETVFFTGGNGSGKTTLVQLMVGLLRPAAGRIVVDGREVDEDSRQAYRDLFAVVFSDCHLFKRLYGLGEPDAETVDRWLDLLEIREKTGIANGEFSTIDLSSGQRKRVALMVAMLEDRPIVVLDEWAADQDPEFRRKFYRELLAELKRRGKTVIAITHDDRYFDAADRRISMEYGKIASDTGRRGDE